MSILHSQVPPPRSLARPAATLPPPPQTRQRLIESAARRACDENPDETRSCCRQTGLNLHSCAVSAVVVRSPNVEDSELVEAEYVPAEPVGLDEGGEGHEVLDICRGCHPVAWAAARPSDAVVHPGTGMVWLVP